MMNAEERTALVTGSARGIGLAVSNALARNGFRVVGLDVLDHGGPPFAATHRVDLADAVACMAAADTVGRVDVLVNNAAVLLENPIEAVTVSDFDRTMAVNLRAPFLLCRPVLLGMAERGWGRVINISSIGGRTGGLPQSLAYSASKAGLISLTKGLARQYAKYGVTVNALAPGGVTTPASESQPLEVHQWALAQIPAERYAEPAEIASVVAFLASDGASYINGATIHVDGGWVMW